MSTTKHGLSVGIQRIDDQFFVVIKAIGTLQHQDYEIISPLLDSALAQVKSPKVNVLVDGTELNGWELRAAWDDLKLGLKHNNEFNKIAFYGNKNWQELSAKVSAWFVSGELKYFENINDAQSWLIAPET